MCVELTFKKKIKKLFFFNLMEITNYKMYFS